MFNKWKMYIDLICGTIMHKLTCTFFKIEFLVHERLENQAGSDRKQRGKILIQDKVDGS